MGIRAVKLPDGRVVYDYDTGQEGIQGRRMDNYSSREEFLANDPYMQERDRRAGEAQNWQQYGQDGNALAEFAKALNGDEWWRGRLDNMWNQRQQGNDKTLRAWGTSDDFYRKAEIMNRYDALRRGGYSHDDIMRVGYANNQEAYTPTFGGGMLSGNDYVTPSGNPNGSTTVVPPTAPPPGVVSGPAQPPVVVASGGELPHQQTNNSNPSSYRLFGRGNEEMRKILSKMLENRLFG